MVGSRIWTLKSVAAWVALLLAMLLPFSVLAQDMTLTLTAQPGTFTGKWVYRSFSISSKPGDTLAKLALGLNELELTEQGGRIVGKRTGSGVSYDLSGVARYIAKQGATIRLHGQATIGGKLYNYDYFGYLIPAWGVSGAVQPDTIMGTVLRSDPANPSNAPLIASFAATRE
ncbi:MAG: hypothetical protein ABIY37_10045 [Devosia sp.]